MFKLVKDADLLKNEIYNEYELTYYFYYNDQIIGTGALRKDDTNMMLFYIKPNYRGNGYGTILFNNLAETARELYSIEEMNLMINKDNIRAIRIIKHKKNIIIGEDSKFVNYKIKI